VRFLCCCGDGAATSTWLSCVGSQKEGAASVRWGSSWTSPPDSLAIAASGAQRSPCGRRLRHQGTLARALADQNTPPVARSWGYRMNMGMDVFESMFAKAKATPRETLLAS
jgi:hypothetical protein